MGRNPIILGLLDALHIPREGVTGIDLIIERREFVRLEIKREVTADEMSEVTQWILRHGIEAEAVVVTSSVTALVPTTAASQRRRAGRLTSPQ